MTGKHDNDVKRDARSWLNSKIFRHFGGAIPANRSYVCLCHTQPRTNSELSQLVDSGIITARQFCGVDLDERNEIIAKNREWWPESRFYRMDYAAFVATEFSNIDVGGIYLDSTSTAVSPKLITMVIDTMHRCKGNTVLCVNVMLNNPKYHDRRWNSNVFTDELSKKLTRLEHRRWFDENFDFKVYCAHKTVMAQYFFTSDLLRGP